MAVRFPCPECGKLLKLDVPLPAGKKVRCCFCKEVFRTSTPPPGDTYQAKTAPRRIKPTAAIPAISPDETRPSRRRSQRRHAEDAPPPRASKRSPLRLLLLLAVMFLLAAATGAYYWHLDNEAVIRAAAQEQAFRVAEANRQRAAQLPNNPAVTLPNSSAVTLPNSPAVTLPNSPTVTLPNSPTVKLPNSPATQLPNSPAVKDPPQQRPPTAVPGLPPAAADVELTVRKRPERFSVRMRMHSRIKLLEGEGAGTESTCTGTYLLQEEIRVPAPKQGDQLFTLLGGRVTHSINGKDMLLSLEWENFVQQIGPTQAVFERDDQGSVVGVALGSGRADDERLQSLQLRALQNLEVLAIPLVSRKLKPGQSCGAPRPIPIPPLGEGPPPGSLDLDFRYIGLREVALERPPTLPSPTGGVAQVVGPRRAQVAVLALSGSIVAKDNDPRPEGAVSGEVWVNPESGTVYLVDLGLEMKVHRTIQNRSVLVAVERLELSLVRDNVAALPGTALPGELLGCWSLVKEVRNGEIRNGDVSPPRTGEESWWIFHSQGVQFGNNRGHIQSAAPATPRPDIARSAIDIGMGQTQSVTDPRVPGAWLPCTYVVTGNTLKLSINTRSADRPSQLHSPPDSGLHLLTFERVQGWSPGYRRELPGTQPKKKDPPRDEPKQPLVPLTPDVWEPPSILAQSPDLAKGLVRIKLGGTWDEKFASSRISPDGKTVAAMTVNGRLHLFHPDAGKQFVDSVAREKLFRDMTFSADGRFLLTASRDDQRLFFWDAVTGKLLKEWEMTGVASSIALSPRGRYALSFGYDQVIRLWDPLEGKQLFSLKLPARGQMAITPSGKFLVVGSNAAIHVVELPLLKIARTIPIPVGGRPWDPIIAPSEKQVYFLHDKGAYCFDLDTGQKLHERADLKTGALLASGTQLLHELAKGHIRQLLRADLTDAGPPDELLHSAQAISSVGRTVAWQSNETLLVLRLCADDPLARARKEPAALPLKVKDRVPIVAERFYFETDPRVLAIRTDKDTRVTYWDLAAGKTIASRAARGKYFGAFLLTADRNQLWMAAPVPNLNVTAYDAAIEVVDVKTEALERLRGHSGLVFGMHTLGDGKTVLSEAFDHTVRVWDIATGKNTHTFTEPKDFLAGARPSPDGKRALLRWRAKPDYRLVDLDTGRDLRTIPALDPALGLPHISSDGSRAVLTDEYKLYTWDLETGQQSREWLPYLMQRGVYSQFSAHGRLLFLGDPKTNLLIVWDTEQRKELGRYSLPVPWESIAVSPDARLLCVADEKGIAIIER